MARASRVVVVGVVMLAIISLACAAKSAPAPTDDFEDEDYSIGDLTADAAASPNSVIPGPIGGPVPPGAFDNAKGGPSAASSSSLHHFSVSAAAALAGFFYL